MEVLVTSGIPKSQYASVQFRLFRGTEETSHEIGRVGAGEGCTRVVLDEDLRLKSREKKSSP